MVATLSELGREKPGTWIPRSSNNPWTGRENVFHITAVPASTDLFRPFDRVVSCCRCASTRRRSELLPAMPDEYPVFDATDWRRLWRRPGLCESFVVISTVVGFYDCGLRISRGVLCVVLAGGLDMSFWLRMRCCVGSLCFIGIALDAA